MLAKLTLFCDFSSSKQHFLQIQEQLLHFCNVPYRLIPYLCKTNVITDKTSLIYEEKREKQQCKGAYMHHGNDKLTTINHCEVAQKYRTYGLCATFL